MSRRALLFVESNTSGTGRLFVAAARDMGFRTVLITTRPQKYAFLAEPGAPEVIEVKRIDEDELDALIRLRFANGAEVAGITSSSEYFVATAAALAARFGLAGPDASAVRAARDKSHQRAALAAAGLPTPEFRAVTSAVDAVAAAREIGFPVIVKPVAGSGSEGVRLCGTPADAGSHAARLLSKAAESGAPRRVLVEEYVSGPEFSVEMFSGQVVGITRKHLGRPPFFVEAGHDFPAAVTDDVAAALLDTAVRGTELLGLGWGPLHWELRVKDGRAYPMEVNPRLAGGFIPELVRHAHGIDLVRETVRLVAGFPVALLVQRRAHASIRFLFAPHAGRLRAVLGFYEAVGRPHVEDVRLYRRRGDDLEVHGDFRDRVGHVIACAKDADTAALAAERARELVALVVEAPAPPPQFSASSALSAPPRETRSSAMAADAPQPADEDVRVAVGAAEGAA
jgi:biotin carboxylase